MKLKFKPNGFTFDFRKQTKRGLCAHKRGRSWYRQDCKRVCKHAGARLFTPSTNDDRP